MRWLLVVLAISAPAAFAQEVDTSVLDGSILVKFTNTSGEDIERLVFWFTSDHEIESYTMEPGWLDSSTGDTVAADGTLPPGQAVHFGIRYQGADPQMAWQATFADDTVTSGWVLGPPPRAEPVPVTRPATGGQSSGILDDSLFRIVPAHPSAGSPVRVVGEGFAPLHILYAQVEGISLGSLVTDASGNFVITRTLPAGLEGRVDFGIADSENGIMINLRLGEPLETRETARELHMDSLDAMYLWGSSLHISGTSPPGTVVVSIYGPDGARTTTAAAGTDEYGYWSLEPRVVAVGTAAGVYDIVVTNGTHSVQDSVVIESGKSILLQASRTVFQQGDILRFTGTANPDSVLWLQLLDTGGREITTSILDVDSTGQVRWEYPTTFDFREGTYSLVATQDDEQDIFYASIGLPVAVPVTITFDRYNYITLQNPSITIAGLPDDEVTLLILSPTDNVVHEAELVLPSTGKLVYEISIDGYTSGIYTAIAQKGTAHTEYMFGVGLPQGASFMDMSISGEYRAGETVQILGQSSKTVVIVLSLLSPSGDTVQSVTTFSGKTGAFSDNRLRIPPDAAAGIWTVSASSGPASDEAAIMIGGHDDGRLQVEVVEGETGPVIVVSGATGTYVTVAITDGGISMGDDVRAQVTGQGFGQLPWSIEISGAYIITVTDGERVAQTAYTYIAP